MIVEVTFYEIFITNLTKIVARVIKTQSTILTILLFSCLHFYAVSSFAGTIESQSRDELKRNFKLQAMSSSYTWRYDKSDADSGSEILNFENLRSIEIDSPLVQTLTSHPWYSLINPELFSDNEKEAAPFSNLPIMKIEAVDIRSIPVYHLTQLAAVPEIVQIDKSGERLKGRLNWENLKLTNPNLNPAFYTTIDPRNSREETTQNNDAIIHIDIKNKKDVFVLELNEPVSHESWPKFFELLTGDPNFWADYVKIHKSNANDDFTGYDFDLFHNAVVTVLQEKYHCPIDMIIYTKDYKVRDIVMGSVRSIYNWVIVFDRSLLKGAVVTNVFNNLQRRQNVRSEKTDGVDDSQWLPFTKKSFDLFLKHPNLMDSINDVLGSSNLSHDPEVVPLILKNPDFFWLKFMPQIESDANALRSSLLREISVFISSNGYDTDKIKSFVRSRVLQSLRRQYQAMDRLKMCRDIFN